jgi:hypothetical protein
LKQVDKLADKQKDNNVNSGKIINIDGFIRHIAAGTEYYSSHARKIAQNFITAAKGQNPAGHQR